jgi:V/A-type H+-transporting ATPase subunit D
MSDLGHVPPGRAGRLWLLERLRAGRRAADLLDRKLRILRVESERLRRAKDEARHEWDSKWRLAQTWAARAAVLGGEREHRLSSPPEPARVELEWTQIMGVRYPEQATVRIPSPSAEDRTPGTAAMVAARTAFQDALASAIACAAAEEAHRVVAAEVTAVRRRLRALTDRWLPRTEEALRRVVRELDETERGETFRLRWAASRGAGTRDKWPR